MELTKASATGLDTAQKCLARYVATQQLVRGAEPSNHAALVGSVCHRALELFVTQVIQQALFVRDKKTLNIFCMQAYCEIYDDNLGSDAYKECWKICSEWYDRNSFTGFRVVSCEIKENFLVTGLSSGVDIPFNFIIDRLDEIKPGTEYRVVDYKSFQVPVSPEELHGKIQARAYALACQIKYPTATRIWVAFDLLRHNRIVQSSFSREESIATWKEIKQTCERILAVDPANPPETVNDTCNFCVRKTQCKTLLSNAKAGGIFSYEDLNSLIDARRIIKDQKKGIDQALKDMDKQIMALLTEQSTTKLETEKTVLSLRSRQNRKVDPLNIEELVGETIFKRYADTSLTIENFEQLLLDPDVADNPDLIERLQNQIQYVPSASWIDTKPKKEK